MTDTIWTFLRNLISIFSIFLSILFFLKSVYFGFTYLDGYFLTRKSVKVSTHYFSLSIVSIIAAYIIFALPPVGTVILLVAILAPFLSLYYIGGLISVKIGEKIQKNLLRF